MRTSCVCFVVAGMKNRLVPADRYVDPVFQQSRRHYAGSIRDLVFAGSVEFGKDAVEHVGLCFVAKKAGAQRFIIDASASNRHFLRPELYRCVQARDSAVLEL